MANTVDDKKRCKDCGQSRPLNEYSLGSNGKARAACKPCTSERAKVWRDNNWERALDTHLKRVFGITLEDFLSMEQAQGGVCAICGCLPPHGLSTKHRRQGRAVRPRLVVDHCHETGEVRGLLCTPCNRGIGFLGDDLDRIEAAANYLRGGQ